MPQGTVKFFDNMRNFGFIKGDDGKDYFVHRSGLKEGTNLKEEDKVSFKIVQGDRGPKAEEVEKIEESEEEEAEEEESEKEEAEEEESEKEEAEEEESEKEEEE